MTTGLAGQEIGYKDLNTPDNAGKRLQNLSIFRRLPDGTVDLAARSLWVLCHHQLRKHARQLQRQAVKSCGTAPAFLLVSQHLRPATTLIVLYS